MLACLKYYDTFYVFVDPKRVWKGKISSLLLKFSHILNGIEWNNCHSTKDDFKVFLYYVYSKQKVQTISAKIRRDCDRTRIPREIQ